MAFWMGKFDFNAGPFARIDLNAMAASATAHAAVAALLVFTWGETVLVEGGERPHFVSIDLNKREGGPGPKPQPLAEARRPQERPVSLPAEVPSQAIVTKARPAAQPQPQPATQASGGGQGRIGDGTAETTTRELPTTQPIPAAALVAAAPGPKPRLAPTGAESVADSKGGGGTGGGNTDQAGNSAVSNFSGRVYQHLKRYQRGNTIGAGEALVAFLVEPSGAARAIRVARTSGSSRFDHEAIALVRRASPFPRPPDGEAHSFSFTISGQ